MRCIPQATYVADMEQTVLPALAERMQSGTFSGFDGKPLCWYAFPADSPKATLVILHGFTESARKYAELIHFFLQEGYSVYLYEQRGHGKSYRDLPDLTLTHVERFSDYVADLECFLQQVVPKEAPLYLFAHSMGGAVGGLFMEKHPETFAKAVLSAPMIAPARGGFPLWVSKLICRAFLTIGKGKDRLFLSSPYPGKEEFANGCCTSEERFAFYESYKRQTPHAQNHSPTYRWTYESLCVTKKLLAKGKPEAIQTNVLLCSATQDTVVLNDKQRQFAARLPHGSFKQYDAKHEIYGSVDAVLQPYLDDLLAFYAN